MEYTYKIQGQVVATNTESALIPFVGNKCTRENVFALEKFLKTLPGTDTSRGDVTEYFAQGVYARKLVIPSGRIATGDIHLQSQINILLSGTVQVTTEDGVKELRAPQIIVSPPGTKRAICTLTKTEWVTFLGTDLTDGDDILAKLTTKELDDPRLEDLS